MGRFLILLVAGVAFAETAADPLTDRMRYELAAAQRDYLIAQREFERAAAQLKTKVTAAEKACADAGKGFSIEALICTDKESK